MVKLISWRNRRLCRSQTWERRLSEITQSLSAGIDTAVIDVNVTAACNNDGDLHSSLFLVRDVFVGVEAMHKSGSVGSTP